MRLESGLFCVARVIVLQRLFPDQGELEGAHIYRIENMLEYAGVPGVNLT